VQNDGDDDDNARRLIDSGRQLSAAQVRQLLVAEDPGISFGTLLRFRELKILAGGEFKLCFCDSALLSDNQVCSKTSHYSIEIGSIHSTGLQCLLSNEKLTKGTCVSQFYGGLRCYDDEAPQIDIPNSYMGVPRPGNPTDLEYRLMSFCQFATKKETKEFDFCEQYKSLDSTPVSPDENP